MDDFDLRQYHKNTIKRDDARNGWKVASSHFSTRQQRAHRGPRPVRVHETAAWRWNTQPGSRFLNAEWGVLSRWRYCFTADFFIINEWTHTTRPSSWQCLLGRFVWTWSYHVFLLYRKTRDRWVSRLRQRVKLSSQLNHCSRPGRKPGRDKSNTACKMKYRPK